MTKQTHSWWTDLYDENLADILLDTPQAHQDAAQEADFLIKHCQLQAGDLVFDQCCGTGRLAKAMADRLMSVIAVELCSDYVERARNHCKTLAVELYCDDAFTFISKQPCRLVYNWWTSFGYAKTDKENIRMMQRAYDSLQAGGWFALDFHNPPAIYRQFNKTVINKLDGQTLVRTSHIDLERGRLEKLWTWTNSDGQQREYKTSVRLYQAHELIALSAQAGFINPVVFGDIDGSPLEIDSRRCILLARKPT